MDEIGNKRQVVMCILAPVSLKLLEELGKLLSKNYEGTICIKETEIDGIKYIEFFRLFSETEETQNQTK